MTTSIDRTTVVRGGGTVKLGTVQSFDKANISAVVETEWNEDKVSGWGVIDRTKADELVRVGWTPSGQISAALLGMLYPYGSTAIDASLGGATDTAAEVHSLLGKKLTLHNAFITGMPNLTLGAQETPFAEAQLTALIKNSTARTAAAAIYTLADATWSGTFTRSTKVKASYSGAWNSIDIIPADSWKIEFDLSANPQKTDDLGTYDMTLGGLTVRAKCRPANLSETLWDSLRMQNADAAAIGSSGRQAKDLVITADIAGAIDITLKDCTLVEGPLAWGEDELRAGEIGFVANRDITSGYGALFTISLST